MPTVQDSNQPGTDMLPNYGRLQTEAIQDSVCTKICTRIVLNFRSFPCGLRTGQSHPEA